MNSSTTPQNERTAREASLVQQVRMQMIVIAIMTIIIIGGLFLYFYLKAHITTATGSAKFLKEADDNTGSTGIKNYGRAIRYTDLTETQGVFFDTEVVRSYLDTKLPDIIRRHQTQLGTNPFPPEYQWKLGFYWAVRNDEADPTKKRMAFYVVPVIYDSKKKAVLDYFDAANNSYYNHPGANDPKNIYDEGQLWP